MEALEFLKERKRLCNSYKNCDGCPFVKGLCAISDITSDEERKSVIATVEQWAKEYPRKTRQSVFLEQYPEAKIDNTGVLDVCPTLIVYSHRTDEGECIDINRKCFVCRREFWMQEVE
nr:MAG TPA: hypothetical protein [Caudoviricetes sp.]